MTPRSRATVTGRIKEPQTLSSPVSRWEHRLLVAHQRNSVFSELRQRTSIEYTPIPINQSIRSNPNKFTKLPRNHSKTKVKLENQKRTNPKFPNDTCKRNQPRQKVHL